MRFDNCTVHGDWGGDHTYLPRWWLQPLPALVSDITLFGE